MNNRILYYSSINTPSTYNYIIKEAANYKLTCVIAATSNSLFNKINNTKIIVFNDCDVKEIRRFSSIINKNDVIYCNIGNFAEILKNYHDKKAYFTNLKSELSAFLDFINLPPINTSNIILKHTLFIMKQSDQHYCHYNEIKTACKYLRLDWNTEKIPLRKTLKKWSNNLLLNNFNFFKLKDEPFNILTAITQIFEAFLLKIHKNINSKTYDLKGKIESLMQEDYLFMKNAIIS